MIRKYKLTIAVPAIVIVILLYFFLRQQNSEEATTEDISTISTISQITESVDEKTIDDTTIQQQPIIVDVRGQVKYPGVYELTLGDRIIDAIEAAGGYTKKAETESINHAQKLQDEMRIYVPKIGEIVENNVNEEKVSVSSVELPSENNDSNSQKVNLNSADETALTTLPGIGPSKAQAILAYRDENGPFKSIDDLKNVSGIGDKTFEKLKELIDIK